MKRFKVIALAATTFLALSLAFGLPQHNAAAQTTAAPRAVPKFEVDPSWPKLPAKWVSARCRASQWTPMITRGYCSGPRRSETIRKGMAAPPVLEFDAAGNFMQGWGGPGEGYDWPEIEHGIYIDPKGFVWIGGNGKSDNHLVKFTKAGKFVMQIGKKGASKGNTDTKNVKEAADTFVYAKTNELFVADGYGNNRIIVFDARHRRIQADVGRLRQNSPSISRRPSRRKSRSLRALQQKKRRDPARSNSAPVHAARVSNDGLVYVSDRAGKRVQVFKLDGKYVTQKFIDRWCEAPHCGNGQTSREHRILTGSGAAVSICRQPQPGARMGARPQDARAARLVRPARHRARRVLCDCTT